MKYTGERFIPNSIKSALISFEHWHRYIYAKQFSHNKAILDVASGSGYGSSLLSGVAESVKAVDVSESSITYARETYERDNIEFIQGDICQLPFENSTFDVVTSFETIEHISEQQQDLAMKEIKRVLKPDGLLLISTPNLDSQLYKDVENEFHIKEFDYREFTTFVNRYFRFTKLVGQSFLSASLIFDEEQDVYNVKSIVDSNYNNAKDYEVKEAKFAIAACSNSNLTEVFLLNGRNSLLLDSQNAFFGEYDEYVESLKKHLEQKEQDIKNSIEYAESLKKHLEQKEQDIKNSIEYTEHLVTINLRLNDEASALQAYVDKQAREVKGNVTVLQEANTELQQRLAVLAEFATAKEIQLKDAGEAYVALEKGNAATIEELQSVADELTQDNTQLNDLLAAKEGQLAEAGEAYAELKKDTEGPVEELQSALKETKESNMGGQYECDSLVENYQHSLIDKDKQLKKAQSENLELNKILNQVCLHPIYGRFIKRKLEGNMKPGES